MPLSMSFLVASSAKRYQILRRVVAQPTPPLQVMDLKIFHSPARLATPAVSLQDCTAQLAISFRVKSQPRPSGADPRQSATWTFSKSCFRCDSGRPAISRVRADKRASWFPVSKLAPARKSAQIISKQ